jgi:hypothetical protein
MPCQGGPTERESLFAATEAVNRLTAENNRLRELVLRLVDGETITKQELARIAKDQTAHRKEDLARLERTLREAIIKGATESSNAYEMLGRVVMADPSQPLEPQLGFDPDSI